MIELIKYLISLDYIIDSINFKPSLSTLTIKLSDHQYHNQSLATVRRKPFPSLIKKNFPNNNNHFLACKQIAKFILISSTKYAPYRRSYRKANAAKKLGVYLPSNASKILDPSS